MRKIVVWGAGRAEVEPDFSLELCPPDRLVVKPGHINNVAIRSVDPERLRQLWAGVHPAHGVSDLVDLAQLGRTADGVTRHELGMMQDEAQAILSMAAVAQAVAAGPNGNRLKTMAELELTSQQLDVLAALGLRGLD